jgi:putative DNA methylase
MKKNEKKKLIEVALPLEAINYAAMKEKDNPFLKGHPRALHQWFARRPLPTCRAILFAQMVDDPSSYPEIYKTEEQIESERERLFDIIRELVVWENMTNISILDKARGEIRKSCDGIIPAIYDPFSGGGAIPFEAQRLGAKAFASDLNPVAVTIARSMVEIPQRFWDGKPVHPDQRSRLNYEGAQGLIEDIMYYGKRLKEICCKKL